MARTASRPRRERRETSASTRAKYPRHAVERALRIPTAILEQNAGKPCSPDQAAKFLGLTNPKGPFAVEIASAIKYKFLDKIDGKLRPSDLARRIIRPTSNDDAVKGYREAILNAPDLSDVYKHYRGENLPDDDVYFRNTVVDTFHIPAADYDNFRDVFFQSLESAHLLEKHGDKQRVIDATEAASQTGQDITKQKKSESSVRAKGAESCFVMQPFAAPLGEYFEKIFKPAVEKAGLTPVRADADIFGTGKIIDQVWRGINSAKILIAELTTRNPNVFYELGLAHALNKPVILISSNEIDVPFDLQHIRVVYYDVNDPFWGAKLIDKVSEKIVSALERPEEAIFKIDERK
jgi:hypothetical protein